MDLPEVRTEIDRINQEILSLFRRRMDCAKTVAEIKKKEHLPIFDAQREREILEKVRQDGGEYGSSAQILFATIMDLSRALQYNTLDGGIALRTAVKDAATQLFVKNSRVACPGVPGSFSGEAAEKLFPESVLSFYPNFSDIFQAIAQGTADFGVVPVENSSAGSVTDVYDLILQHRFFIVGGIDLSIHHCLAANGNVPLTDIKEVYSHPQALAQCTAFIEQHKYTVIPYSNTAAAAEMISNQKDGACAAICSRMAARKYGLTILADGIQNNSNNCTRFIVIAKQTCIPKDADKISLCFSLPHTTGSLYHILSRFAVYGLNLTKIESRPIPGKSFEYLFYLDFSGNVHNAEVLNFLCALSDELPSFSFLGNYKEQVE